LDAAINRAQVTGDLPEQVTVVKVDLTKPKPRESSPFDDGPEDRPVGPAASTPKQPALFSLSSDAKEWKDAVYAKLVAKVGDRMYWDDWAGDIAQIAQRFIALITAHVNAPENDRVPFDGFVKALRATVNPEVTDGEAVELLAQHLITKPVFEAMFPEGSFAQDNPVSTAMEHVLATFDENSAFTREREPLDTFYGKVTERIRGLDSVR